MEVEMNIDRAVLAFAGLVVLTSLVLAWYVSPYWLGPERHRSGSKWRDHVMIWVTANVPEKDIAFVFPG
jgi:hypothetical protein